MTLKRLCGIITIIGFISSLSIAQDRWSWPEEPENIQVLPKEITGRRLQPVMTGFARALGVRCTYCHVGEEGKPFSSFDFASDAKPNKDRARSMLRMLGDINEHLKKMDKSSDVPVNMWCHTCHRGNSKPVTLEEELGSVYRSQGLEPAIAHYSTLKDRYYGKGVFNFGEEALNNFGYTVLGADEKQGAIKVFTLLTQEFPGSANAWDSLAEAYLQSGDRQTAKEFYEKSLSLDPKNRNATQMLEKIAAMKD